MPNTFAPKIALIFEYFCKFLRCTLEIRSLVQDIVTSMQSLQAQRVRALNSHSLPNTMPNTFCCMQLQNRLTPPN